MEDEIRNISQQWFGKVIMINIAVYIIFHFPLLKNKSHRLDMSLKWSKDTELFEMHCHEFINVLILLLSSTKESRLYWWRLSCFLSPPPEGSLSDSSAQPSSAPGSLNNSTWASIIQSPFLLFFFFFPPSIFSFLALSTFLLAPEPLR